ncbi:MAG: NIL domain-containing protein [Aphanocapsa lilacina HA4352-LM1]|nr:NIL domain-containing protein [Aphanocapsa lilacina HA4352-LM1]
MIAALSPETVRLRLRVPGEYRGEPMITTLIARWGISVCITGAELPSQPTGDGRFELSLVGSPPDLLRGVLYLQDAGVEIEQMQTGYGSGEFCHWVRSAFEQTAADTGCTVEAIHSDEWVSARVELSVKRIHREQPVLARLVEKFGLRMNITRARLGPEQPDGWFVLELGGEPRQLAAGLAYLRERCERFSAYPD